MFEYYQVQLKYLEALLADHHKHLTGLVEYKQQFKYDSIVKETIDFAIGIDSLVLAAKHLGNLIWFYNGVIGKPKEGVLIFNTYSKKIKNYLKK